VSFPPCTAGKAAASFLLELAHDWCNTGALESFDVLTMSAVCVRAPSCVGAEVIDLSNRKMRRGCEYRTERFQVYPQKVRRSGLVQGVIKVESVDIRRDPNNTTPEMKMPVDRSLQAPRSRTSREEYAYCTEAELDQQELNLEENHSFGTL